ncbi:hypothetical protein D3C71_1458100 [compost metagenome]
MAQRQEAHAFIALVLRQEDVQPLHHDQQAPVRMHRALGLSGGAGGVDEDGQLVGTAQLTQPIELAGMGLVVGGAFAAQRIEGGHHRVAVPGQAGRVDQHDLAQAWQTRPCLQRLIELFLVLHHQHHGVRVLAEELHLARRVGRIDAIGNAGGAQHCHVEPDPFDARVRQDRRAVTRLQASGREAHSKLAHDHADIARAPGLPQSEGLLAHHHGVAARGDRVPEHARHGVARHHDVVVRRQVIKIPESGHVHRSFHRHVFFFFQRRSPRAPSSFMPR